MKTFKVEEDIEIEVKFKNPEQIKEVFLGKIWEEVFWKFDGLADVAEYVARNFYEDYIVGFEPFQFVNGIFRSFGEAYGGVLVKVIQRSTESKEIKNDIKRNSRGC